MRQFKELFYLHLIIIIIIIIPMDITLFVMSYLTIDDEVNLILPPPSPSKNITIFETSCENIKLNWPLFLFNIFEQVNILKHEPESVFSASFFTFLNRFLVYIVMM